jgi:inorganic pyrophosphatase
MNLVNDIPIGQDYPLVVNAVVEVEKDSNSKYEYVEELNIFRLSRCLYSSMRYTCSYGFIPQTYALDDDPLDILIYNNVPLRTSTLVEVKPIGVLDMDDTGKKDYKVVGVPTSHIKDYKNLKDLDPHWLATTLQFFTHYKDLEKDKTAIVNGWLNKSEAKKIINAAHKRWKNKLNSGLSDL